MSNLLDALDAAHTALRMVDASNTAVPQAVATLDAVSEAIALVERVALAAGHKLPEFQRKPPRLSEEELRNLMRDPRYWQTREPEIVNRVAAGFRALWVDQEDVA